MSADADRRHAMADAIEERRIYGANDTIVAIARWQNRRPPLMSEELASVLSVGRFDHCRREWVHPDGRRVRERDVMMAGSRRELEDIIAERSYYILEEDA